MKPNSPRLLCATDFSSQADEAAFVAAKLAARLHQTLLLVHAAAVTGPAIVSPARRRLRLEALRLRETGAVVEPVLLREFPAGDALVHLIAGDPPALVVMSSAAKKALDRWKFGSVSEQVAQASPVPTLMIHRGAPLERWLAGGQVLRVVVALDLFTTSDAVLRWVRELRQAGPCEIVACHFNAWQPHGGGRGLDPRSVVPVNPPQAQARLERELKKKVRDQLGDDDPFRIVVRPDWGVASSVLLDVAEREKADLVVIGSHQRKGLSRLLHGSLSRAVLREAKTNVACVPIAAEFDPRHAHIPEYRRVLVATDFSELGNAAIPYACAACLIGGLVRIIHVVPPSRRRSAKGVDRAGLGERLRQLIPAEMGARGQPPEVALIEDPDPATAICAEADRFGADLVCLASHGTSASRDVFGSVTEAVLKQIRRPLLVVRRPDE